MRRPPQPGLAQTEAESQCLICRDGFRNPAAVSLAVDTGSALPASGSRETEEKPPPSHSAGSPCRGQSAGGRAQCLPGVFIVSPARNEDIRMCLCGFISLGWTINHRTDSFHLCHQTNVERDLPEQLQSRRDCCSSCILLERKGCKLVQAMNTNLLAAFHHSARPSPPTALKWMFWVTVGLQKCL